jgi:hypothetical protein
MAVIDDGTYAVQAEDVSVVYKSTTAAVPPAPAIYALRVIPQGVGNPYGSQLRFADESARDDFYKKLVDAMRK